MPTFETGRLLTVISLYKNKDGIIEITFLESPAVFEIILGTKQDSLMYKLLSQAHATQLPVNVFITAENNKNIIKKVLPATDEQMKSYLKEKNKRNDAKPVPKPDGM